MNKCFHLMDSGFEQQFESYRLDSKPFDHKAQLRLTSTHITKYGIESGPGNIQSQLKTYVKHLGGEYKYNTAITIAVVKAVYHFILNSQSDSFQDLIDEFPRLKNNFKGLMNSHYGIDIFKSQKAKEAYIRPDLLPFD